MRGQKANQEVDKMEVDKFSVQEGSYSIAESVALCKPEVISYHPILPQTHIIQRLSELIDKRKLDSELVRVESHNTALSLIAGATASGVRSYTATSSQGLASMHELLHAVSGMRLPVVMTVTNRALGTPINVWNDHSDSISQRDTSWIQIYVESVQEAVDTHLQAYKIAEEVMLPVMVCVDGYSLTHSFEPVIMPSQKTADDFLPPFEFENKLDPDNPATIGTLVPPDNYIDFKYQQQKAMDTGRETIKEVNRQYKKSFNRDYGDGLVVSYGNKEDENAIIAMGSICSVIREVIEDNGNLNCSLIRLRSFRPFPDSELKKAIKDKVNLGVIDKSYSYGKGGQLFTEVKSITNIPTKGFIAGLGGKKITKDDVIKIIEQIEGTNEVKIQEKPKSKSKKKNKTKSGKTKQKIKEKKGKAEIGGLEGEFVWIM